MRLPATRPGRRALAKIPFSERVSKGLTKDAHSVPTSEQDLTGHGFSKEGKYVTPESRGASRFPGAGP